MKEENIFCLSLSKVGTFSFQNFQLELSPGWLPTGEERHSLLTLGRTLDWSSLGEAEEDEEVFLPVNIFVWKNQSSVSLRCRELLFQTWFEPTTESLVLELCLDDNRWTTSWKDFWFHKNKKRELESVRIAGGQELECRMEIPACARENLLESARAGKVETRLFQQLARLGLFYLEEVFNVCLYQVF